MTVVSYGTAKSIDTSLLCQVLISDQLPTNMSSHVSVKATLNVSMNNDVMKQKKLSATAVKKLLWVKADKKQYQDSLTEALSKTDISSDPVCTLVQILNSTSKKVIPNKLIKV